MQYLAQTFPAMITTTILPLLRWLVSTETDLLMRTIGSHACSSNHQHWLSQQQYVRGPAYLVAVAVVNLSMTTICSCVRYYLPGACCRHHHDNWSEGCTQFSIWRLLCQLTRVKGVPRKNWKYPNLATITLAAVSRKKLKIVKFVNPNLAAERAIHSTGNFIEFTALVLFSPCYRKKG